METLDYSSWSLGVKQRIGGRRVPLAGTIELTRRCNNRCRHCYNNLPASDLHAHAEELRTDELIRILDEAAAAGCVWLLLTGGEIFLRPDFREIYTHAKQKGLLVTLFTNGTLMTPELADFLANQRPFSLEITLYGATRETYERVTGNPGLPGEVVGTGIVRPAEVPADEVAPRLDLLGDYFVYVGRIEPEKGCAVMIDHFLRWQRETRATATLALFGRSTMSFSENAHVRLMGVVPDGEKLAAIARARALVMPSRHESLSMVVLEAWMMQRPVLVNGDCEVLRGQVLRADGGLYYRRYEEFAAAMDLLLQQPALAERLGRQGQAYFEANYAWPRVMEKYERLLARAAAGKAPGKALP